MECGSVLIFRLRPNKMENRAENVAKGWLHDSNGIIASSFSLCLPLCEWIDSVWLSSGDSQHHKRKCVFFVIRWVKIGASACSSFVFISEWDKQHHPFWWYCWRARSLSCSRFCFVHTCVHLFIILSHLPIIASAFSLKQSTENSMNSRFIDIFTCILMYLSLCTHILDL